MPRVGELCAATGLHWLDQAHTVTRTGQPQVTETYITPTQYPSGGSAEPKFKPTWYGVEDQLRGDMPSGLMQLKSIEHNLRDRRGPPWQARCKYVRLGHTRAGTV